MPMNPYSGVLAWNSAEGGTDGITVSTGNSGGTSGTPWTSVQITGTSTVKYKAAGALHDTMSYEIVGGGGFGMLRWESSLLGTSFTSVCGALYIKFVTLPSSYSTVVNANQVDAGTTIAWRIKVSSTGNVRLTDTADVAVFSTSNSPIAVGTLYRFEWQMDHTTGDYVVEWFSGDSTTALGRYTGAASIGTQVQRIDFGRTTSPDYTALLDTMALNTSKLGPRNRPNTAPTANAGSDKTSGVVGTLMNVTGTDSDSDGTISTREWTCTSYPPGSSVPTLSGASTATVSFTPSATGLYILSYRVQDNSGDWSTPSTVKVYVPGTSITPIAITTNTGAWTNEGGASDFTAALRDSNNATFLQSNASLTTPSTMRIRLAPLAAPASFTLNPSVLLSANGSGTAVVRLYEGSTMRKEWTLSPTTSVTTPSLTLTSGEITTVTSWLALDIEISWAL